MSNKTKQTQTFYSDLAIEIIKLMRLKKSVCKNLTCLIEMYPPQNFTQNVFYNLQGSDSLRHMLWCLDLRLYFDDLVAHSHAKVCSKRGTEFFDDIYKYIHLESFLGPFEDALRNDTLDIESHDISLYKGKYLPYGDTKRSYFEYSLS